MDQHRRDEDEKYLLKAHKYAVSYMSDSKWRKLFTAVDEAGIKIERAVWRFIASDHAFNWGWPTACDLDVVGMKDGRFQPFEYRWIESIFVPREYRPYGDEHVPHAARHQDVDGLVSVLRRAGKFMIEESPEGITILGYGGRQ